MCCLSSTLGGTGGSSPRGPGGTPRPCHGSYADNYQFLFCLFKYWDDPGRRLETCSFWTRPALGCAVVKGPPTTEIRMAPHLSAAVVEGAKLVPGDAAAVGRLLRAHGAVVVRKWRQELAPVHDHPRRVSQRAFFQVVDPGVHVEDEELLRILRAVAYRPVPERFLAYTSQRGLMPGRLIDTKLFSPRLLEPEPHGICLRGFGYDI